MLTKSSYTVTDSCYAPTEFTMRFGSLRWLNYKLSKPKGLTSLAHKLTTIVRGRSTEYPKLLVYIETLYI